ncbi:MAG: hypothetical protein QGI83_00640 [Candidatus Latescibacteria bacterium]|jgi:hypothetical protein|nr:hypothetical protein [Candidatus Latescibacterota bacterium]
MKAHVIGVLAALCIVLTSGPLDAETTGSSTATGTSRSFNPAISVNGLFLGFYTSEPLAREPAFGHAHDEEEDHEREEGDEHEGEGEHAHEGEAGHAHSHGLPESSGLSVQEVEVRLSAAVDAYLKGDITLAIPGTEGLELEEAVLTTIGLPGVTLQAGKFYGVLGKHNTLHTHAFPFVDPPILGERLLGGEGLNEVGLGASFLLPTSWYSELTVQVLDGENALFASEDGEDLAYLGRWGNLWDLSESSTLELGCSYAAGRNGHGELTQLVGGDLTVKWRPLRRARDRGMTLQAEYLQARVDDGADVAVAGGMYALLQAQVSRRWWMQARYDLLGLPKLEHEREQRFSGLLAFVASEFSALRMQYNLNRHGEETVHQLVVQMNFTMGSHPAHSY